MTVDAQLDERTLREIYLPQFEAAIREAGAGSVMCAYTARQRRVRVRERAPARGRPEGRLGVPPASCSPTTAPARARPTRCNNGLDLDIWPGIAYRPELGQRGAGQRPGDRGDGRRARPPHPAHALRLRLLRPRRVRGRRRRGSTRTRTTRRPAELEQEGRCCSRTTARSCRSTRARRGKLALIGPEADEDPRRRRLLGDQRVRITTPRAGHRGAPRRGASVVVRRRLGRRAGRRRRQGRRRRGGGRRRPDERGLGQAVHGAQLLAAGPASTATR